MNNANSAPIDPVVQQLALADAVVMQSVPIGHHVEIRSMMMVNTTAAPATFRLHLRQVGEPAAMSNAIAYDLPVDAYTLYTMALHTALVIPAGYVLSGMASAAAINLIMTGYIVSDAVQ